MQDGMNANELQELKNALIRVERFEILEILRNADSKEDAIAALIQRMKA